MNTENEKNISVILKQPETENESSIEISFSTIAHQLKKFFTLWIVLAIIGGLFTLGVTFIFNKTVSTSTITALINYNYDGISSGLDPAGEELDVNKIKSPNIIEAALTNLDESISYVEAVRRNIKIKSITPSETIDKMTLYQEIYKSGGSAGLEAANTLLDVDYFPSYYLIEFNNYSAGFNLDNGKKIIDEILNAYQDYFFTTYGYNESVGNAVIAVDYKEYDYPAVVDIFKTTLDELDNYVRRINSTDSTSFRSSKTGFNFEDIRRNIATLQDADLDSISSYITINNVTNDSDQLTTYYEYKIEETNRQLKVSQAELKSISDSINSYEKDTMHVFGDMIETDDNNITQSSAKYDELIEKKIEVQEECSSQQQLIEYYKARINNLDSKVKKSEANVEYTEKKLDELYNKINNLIDITIETSDEFYENVVFANAFNILVPSSGAESTVEMNNTLFPAVIIEVIIFMVYIAFSIISAILNDNRKNKEKIYDDKSKITTEE